MMTEEKKRNILKQEEISELKDEQLESVTGGLGVPTVGPVSLNSLTTGQALPEDTGFGKQQRTDSVIPSAARRPKI